MRKQALIRTVAVILVAALLVGIVFVAVANADTTLGVSATVTPQELEGQGKVEVELSLANNGNTTIKGVVLTVDDYSISKDLGDFAAGQKKIFRVSNFKINEYQLGVSIPFVFHWLQDGELKLLEYPIKVNLKKDEPKLEATRTASTQIGMMGDTVKLKYTIKNTGTIDLYSIKIQDPISDTAIVEGLTLESGSGIYVVEYDVILDKTIDSVPVITGITSGGVEVSQTLEPLTLTLVEPSAVIIVTPGLPTQTGTTLDIFIQNNGNIPISQMTVVDELGAVLDDGLTLEAGASKHISNIVSSPDERTVTVTATGLVNDVAGMKATFTSAPVVVSPFIATKDIKIESEVQPGKTILEKAGKLTVVVKLNNVSPVELKNVVISESTTGYTKTLETLPIGVQVITVELDIQKDSTLKFAADFQDTDGRAYHWDMQPVDISVSELTTIIPEGNAQTGVAGWLKGLLIVLIALLVSAVIALGLKLHKEKRIEAEREEADEIERMIIRRGKRAERLAGQSDDITGKIKKPGVLYEDFELQQSSAYDPRRPVSKDNVRDNSLLNAQKPQKRTPVVSSSASRVIGVKKETVEHSDSLDREKVRNGAPSYNFDDKIFEDEFFDKN